MGYSAAAGACFEQAGSYIFGALVLDLDASPLYLLINVYFLSVSKITC